MQCIHKQYSDHPDYSEDMFVHNIVMVVYAKHMLYATCSFQFPLKLNVGHFSESQLLTASPKPLSACSLPSDLS